MWTDILTAVALFLVLEGLWPLANPEGWKRAMRRMLDTDSRQMRIAGLCSMVAGAVLLAIVR